jgi:6-phosphogluconolactonase (cycloisomerase 2 family)
MKFSKLGQLFLVSSIGLIVATLLTACQIVTIDFVYVASSAGAGTASNGQIDIFAVDSESGALRAGPQSVSSGGNLPVAMAVSADYENIYVANQANSSIVHFTLALNGTPTQKDVVTLPAQPISIAVNAAGTYLYVASGPGGGTLTAYSIGTGGTMGAVVFETPLSLSTNPTDIIVPTAVTVLANNSAVYVTAYDQAAYDPGCATCVTSSAHPGWVFGYTVGSGGILTPASNSPFQAGVKPSAIAADPTNRFVYATDFASNQMIGFSVQSGNLLNFLINGPFKTGNEPSAVVIDPRGKYIYVANSLDSSVSAYAIDLTTGTPSIATAATGGTGNGTDTQPLSIVVDPALGRFVYTANYLGNSVSGFRLDPNSGALTTTQATPYPSGAKPTAIVAVPHGNHSLQIVGP